MDKKDLQECCRCRFYKPYFVCESTQYRKLDYGICSCNNVCKATEKHDTCTKFSYKYYERIDDKWTLRKLSEAADSINIIMQILKEKTD